MEGDCLPVIQALSRQAESFSYVGTLLADMKRFLIGCREWKISFVRQRGNVVAHELAQFARHVDVYLLDGRSPKFLVTSLPK